MKSVHPKLPMRDAPTTKAFYTIHLGFHVISAYPDYLIMAREQVEIHFFLFKALDPFTNYGQIYIRTQSIEQLYAELQAKGTQIHPNGKLKLQPWGQVEFSLLDPDHNLLTFGEASQKNRKNIA